VQKESDFLKGFEECFGGLKDERQQSKIDHPLIEVLFVTIVAIAGSAFSWETIESFGKSHLNILRQYYPFSNGVPSDDTIRRVFERILPCELNSVLQRYFSLDLNNMHVAIDGKTLKGSRNREARALHMLNVYASDSGITLFSKAIDSKHNEITAIPEAIECLELKGATVTIDAMGCQKTIAKCILEKEADYIFGLKKNHVTLYNEVADAFSSNAETFFKMDTAQSKEKSHGREEERRCRIIRDLDKISHAQDWPGLVTIIEMQRQVTVNGKKTNSINYYISSSQQGAVQMMKTIRDHWSIESMHWVLDVVFNEDASSMHKGNIPANMAITRRFILNILGQMKRPRESKPKLMKLIGWDDNYLQKFIDKLIYRS